jgi:uncharacterized protein YifE (UPF0438 family)
MTIPSEHLNYLRQTGYALRCPEAFDAEEAAMLGKYGHWGHWMEALATGRIAPVTAEQSHFLQVARGLAQARTPFERIWHKLHNRPEVAAPAQEEAAQAAGKFEQLAEVRSYAEGIRARKEAERQAVLQSVQAQLDAIEARYAEPLAEADEAVAALEEEVKAEVVQGGKSVQASNIRAIYYRGAVTWDSKGLAAYAESHPDVQKFRRVGAPRVLIRYQQEPR